MRARPVRFSVSTGLRLCGMAEEPFWPSEKILLGLQHFGALQVADLGRQPLDRGGDHAERGEIHGVAVARDDLGRDRLGRQAQLRRRHSASTRGSTLAKVPTAPEMRAGRDLLARRDQPLAGAGELGIGVGELEAEGGRLGMDAVAAADGRRQLVLEGAALERGEQRVDVGDEDVGGARRAAR